MFNTCYYSFFTMSAHIQNPFHSTLQRVLCHICVSFMAYLIMKVDAIIFFTKQRNKTFNPFPIIDKCTIECNIT